MPRRAGVITINLNAGTVQFMSDMDKAQAKVRDFGSHTVSSMQASSAAIRTLEGSIPIRAVERFVGPVLGLGPLLERAFPYVGAFVFGEMIIETGKEGLRILQAASGRARQDEGCVSRINRRT